jgi:hypothetical protein
VSPVRIRVPPLLKVLQIVEKRKKFGRVSGAFVNGVSTAGSRKGLL